MFRFFKYIVLFILGYKVLKMLFVDNKQQQSVEPGPQRQNINDNNQQNTPKTPTSKFNDAELIDYEEIK